MNLLDYLVKKCSYEYLSAARYDLRWKDELSKIDETMFSLDDWNETALYLTGEKKKFANSKAAKIFLTEYKCK
ncbi:MAG: hypothetical protein RR246_06735 [Clostridia bacterium]